jgi:hypothetical protein
MKDRAQDRSHQAPEQRPPRPGPAQTRPPSRPPRMRPNSTISPNTASPPATPIHAQGITSGTSSLQTIAVSSATHMPGRPTITASTPIRPTSVITDAATQTMCC